MSKEIDVRELDFLLRFNIDHTYISPLEFLSTQPGAPSRYTHMHTHTHTHKHSHTLMLTVICTDL